MAAGVTFQNSSLKNIYNKNYISTIITRHVPKILIKL